MHWSNYVAVCGLIISALALLTNLTFACRLGIAVLIKRIPQYVLFTKGDVTASGVTGDVKPIGWYLFLFVIQTALAVSFVVFADQRMHHLGRWLAPCALICAIWSATVLQGLRRPMRPVVAEHLGAIERLRRSQSAGGRMSVREAVKYYKLMLTQSGMYDASVHVMRPPGKQK